MASELLSGVFGGDPALTLTEDLHAPDGPAPASGAGVPGVPDPQGRTVPQVIVKLITANPGGI